MSGLNIALKKEFEALYDIPFSVKSGIINNQPWYAISPYNQYYEYFEIYITLVNNIRLNMEFKPQKYSASFIKSMGAQPNERKEIFVKYIHNFLKRKAKVFLSINDMVIDVDDIDHILWPTEWRTLVLRVTRMPLIDCDNLQGIDSIILEWAQLMMGMVMSLVSIQNIETLQVDEGTPSEVISKRYERDKVNRKICLNAKGYCCLVCGFDFYEKYGELGENFIHVHHHVPVSRIRQGDKFDAIRDLSPVCPNCHVMLHKTKPPLTIEELKANMEKIRAESQ